MHTFLTYAYAFSMLFAALALFLATAVYLYAFISLFFASYATVETRQAGSFS